MLFPLGQAVRRSFSIKLFQPHLAGALSPGCSVAVPQAISLVDAGGVDGPYKKGGSASLGVWQPQAFRRPASRKPGWAIGHVHETPSHLRWQYRL